MIKCDFCDKELKKKETMIMDKAPETVRETHFCAECGTTLQESMDKIYISFDELEKNINKKANVFAKKVVLDHLQKLIEEKK